VDWKIVTKVTAGWVACSLANCLDGHQIQNSLRVGFVKPESKLSTLDAVVTCERTKTHLMVFELNLHDFLI